jgi:hypothetical protein
MSRAFTQTRNFWNAHQVWRYLSPFLSGAILRLIVRGLSPVMGWEGLLKELALFVFGGFVITWAGTYLINLVKVPPEVYAEQQFTVGNLREEARKAREAETERNLVNFDFRLQQTEPPSSTHVEVKITPVQRALVKTCRFYLKAWNKGRSHIELSTCTLSIRASSSQKTIKTDVHIEPGAEDVLEITEEIASLVFVQKDWQGFPEDQELDIDLECKGETGRTLTKRKSYGLHAMKTGGFSVEFKIVPLTP